MRYLKDGEEVAQVGDIFFAQACQPSLGSDLLSLPAASPPGFLQPRQRFSFPLLSSRPGTAGPSAAVTWAELGTSVFTAQKASKRCPGCSFESILPIISHSYLSVGVSCHITELLGIRYAEKSGSVLPG